MIHLERVVLRNFGSWKYLDFPLSDQGLVLLTGPTGSGKSTIFRAIYWCLFGKTPEGHRVSDLCRHGTNKCYVRLDFFKTPPGMAPMPFSITRFRNHPVWKNKVSITGRGIAKVDPDSLVEDTDPLIEQLVGFGPDVFSKVFYFVQRDTRRFSSMTDSERKVFLETITHGAFLQACEQQAREHVRSLNHDLDLIHERQRARDDLLMQIRRQSEETDTKDEEVLRHLQAEEKEARQQLMQFRRRYEDVIASWYTLSSSLETQIHFHDQARHSLRAMSGVCPVCASKVSLRQRQERFKELGKSLKGLVKEHAAIEEHIAEYDELRSGVSVVELEQAKVRDRMRMRGQLQLVTPTEQMQAESQRDQEALLDKEAKLRYTQYWVKGFGPLGLRSYMLGRVVRQMTGAINGYLAMIDPGLSATFTVKDQRVIFQGASDRSLATFSGGERQALDLAVGLGLRNMLEASTESIDALILDEPFEGLDQALQVSCQRLLYALPKKSVFLVTHSRFLAMFQKEYEVSKVKGISQLRHV